MQNVIDRFNNDWKRCSDKYPIIVTEGSWNTMDSDQGLRTGTTEVFGNTVRSLYDNAGNISWMCGMTEELIGNMSGGISSFTYPEINCGRAGFDWWPSYTWCAPSSGGTMADGTYKLVARHSGKAMDAYGGQTANGTQIIQWSYGSGANQKWTLTDTGGGTYKIIGVQSGKALDIYAGASANGTKVQLWDYWNGASQQFKFTATDSGYHRITPNCATGSCLDVSGISTADGANVHLWQWVGGQNQQWAPQAP